MSTPTSQEPVEGPGPAHPNQEHNSSDLATALSWSGSILLHALVIALAFAITWMVVNQSADEPPRVITSALQETAHAAVRPLSLHPMLGSTRSDSAPTMSQASEVTAADLSELTLNADSLLAEAALLGGDGFTETSESLPEVRFGGLRASEARRIVFVVDASGSMIGAFPAVRDQLERSLHGLSPKQFFGIVLFQRSQSIEVPPTGRLHSAQPENIQRSIEWISNEVVPRGRSNPTTALRKAFNLDPDVIFVVSTDITGSGEFEIDKQDLMETLDALNPMRSSGTRAVRIRCIQLLDQDPLGTLQSIAAEHGGKEGFAFIDRGQIGLDSSR